MAKWHLTVTTQIRSKSNDLQLPGLTEYWSGGAGYGDGGPGQAACYESGPAAKVHGGRTRRHPHRALHRAALQSEASSLGTRVPEHARGYVRVPGNEGHRVR